MDVTSESCLKSLFEFETSASCRVSRTTAAVASDVPRM